MCGAAPRAGLGQAAGAGRCLGWQRPRGQRGRSRPPRAPLSERTPGEEGRRGTAAPVLSWRGGGTGTGDGDRGWGQGQGTALGRPHAVKRRVEPCKQNQRTQSGAPGARPSVLCLGRSDPRDGDALSFLPADGLQGRGVGSGTAFAIKHGCAGHYSLLSVFIQADITAGMHALSAETMLLEVYANRIVTGIHMKS